MKRREVEDSNGNWIGWFDKDQAEHLASSVRGSQGSRLFATKKGKLVINSWGNNFNFYRLPLDNKEIARIISQDKTLEETRDLHELVNDTLKEYEL